MKEFFERYSYDSLKMLLNQIVSTIFGFSLLLASNEAKNDTLMLVTSLGAILFYLILTYGTSWRVGSRDKITVDLGRRKFAPLTGLYISLLANSVNILFAVLGAIGALADIGGLSLGNLACMWGQCMYQGVLVVTGIKDFWWCCLLLPIPSLLIATVGYVAGVRDFHITRLGVPELPESDRLTKKELKEKKKRDRQS